MRIAHFSDTHLGFRAYTRVNDSGLNQREVDVFRTFERFLEDILSQDPDVVLHTGDFFDKVRPSNHVIIRAFQALTKMQAERKGRPFIIVAGNHETPRTSDAGCILKLFGNIPGLYIADEQLRRFVLEDTEFVCVPYGALHEKDRAIPSGSRASILAMHGLEGSLKYAPDFNVSEMKPDRWDYIALGDYHVHKVIGKNAVYCGSTDYTSTNIWEETDCPKRWVMFDAESVKISDHIVEPVRQVLDLTPIDASGLSGVEIGGRLGSQAVWDNDSLPIVRQRSINVDPVSRAEIPHQIVREIQSRALVYFHEIQYAKSDSDQVKVSGRSLDEDWREFAGKRDLPKSVERKEYVEAGAARLLEVAGVAEED
ncbi:MAG: DNA repair exonuclease [Armatimonadetes bacterium]|nr:DNA repair exonuclease [Armatimonadota bacterium]